MNQPLKTADLTQPRVYATGSRNEDEPPGAKSALVDGTADSLEPTVSRRVCGRRVFAGRLRTGLYTRNQDIVSGNGGLFFYTVFAKADAVHSTGAKGSRRPILQRVFLQMVMVMLS